MYSRMKNNNGHIAAELADISGFSAVAAYLESQSLKGWDILYNYLKIKNHVFYVNEQPVNALYIRLKFIYFELYTKNFLY